MSEDFSNIVNNFSKILEDKNIDLNSVLNSINSKNNEKTYYNPNSGNPYTCVYANSCFRCAYCQ